MIKKSCILLIFVTLAFYVCAQKKNNGRYKSLLWEIRGNGLVKPSYLFGTMHVSSKLVFHLSDSFYLALKSVDVVALELNPETWQGQMMQVNKIKEDYSLYIKNTDGDYLNENSFRFGSYKDDLKQALSSEPTIINSLLYRNFKEKEDFEEDTFLDLYIYQIAKKLGKRAAGVEDYLESEKIILEAYADKAREKKKKNYDWGAYKDFELAEKIEDAYRRGDLDLMDSLDRTVNWSEAFMEKFLYKRNKIQAYSIDTIIKKNSLFAAVGAAHLPGPRGIIELLRKKGYTVRPIFMTDRDADHKETIDKIKVPVTFSTQTAEDSFFTVEMPGPLFKMADGYSLPERWQYSDMANGSYYLITRIKTHAPFLNQDENDVYKKLDSILYENIPGKILIKKTITRNGYKGIDITNRTRRGDLQRYNIFITPFEVLFFKMSGKENYIDGKEAEKFFSSIHFKQVTNAAGIFEPLQGGFSVWMPQQPFIYYNTSNNDGINRWEYEAADESNGNAYLILKKSVYNFQFLEEDSFDLSLIEESFQYPNKSNKQFSRVQSNFKGYPCLDIKEKMNDGSIMQARFIIKGPHYYVLAARGKNKRADFSAFFNSFSFTPYRYSMLKVFTDSFMHFTVQTPVAPAINDDIRSIAEKTEVDLNNDNNGFKFWPKTKNGNFKSDATGETVSVSVQEYPKYYYVKDKSKQWIDVVSNYIYDDGFYIYKTDTIILANDVIAYKFHLRDTGSSRTITRMLMMKDNYSFSLATMGDTLSTESSFIRSFFTSFSPAAKKLGSNITENKPEEFFSDLFSTDSTIQTKAQQSISNIYFGEDAVPLIEKAINKLKLTDKGYFEIKSKLIAELGYIKDSTRPVVVKLLKKIYEQVADTITFQNKVFLALSNKKTNEAIQLFKELILHEPPVLSDEYEYAEMFANLKDSLLLARQLYPELLQLSSLIDYKKHVLSLLVTLIDSNLVKASDYADYFDKIYFDARVELKRQQAKDEQLLEKELSGEDMNNELAFSTEYERVGDNNINDYSVLLSPFYNLKKPVQVFFERLLKSREPYVRLTAAVLLLRNSQPVADSILYALAADDKYRSKLYIQLEKAGRLDIFPAKFKTQQLIAKSFLIPLSKYQEIDSVVFLKKLPVAYYSNNGMVYCFKYKIDKTNDWKIGFSGLQPLAEKQISTDNKLTTLTDKNLNTATGLDEQLQNELKKLLFSLHESSREFYNNQFYRIRYNNNIEN